MFLQKSNEGRSRVFSPVTRASGGELFMLLTDDRKVITKRKGLECTHTMKTELGKTCK